VPHGRGVVKPQPVGRECRHGDPSGLEKIVEATRVAVDGVLQTSGRALGVKREAGIPASTT
jgi:hypothetical protein